MAKPFDRLGRRSLLLGLTSLALTQLMASCLGRGRSPRLVVEFLASSLPPSLLKQVEAQLQTTISLKLTPIAQLTDSKLSARLLEGKSTKPESEKNPSKSVQPNLVSLGDGWLGQAIQSESLQPLALETRSGWKRMPPAFQQLVTRNNQGFPAQSGSVWAAPYRWGQLMIAYRVDKLEPLGWTPTDWSDLWHIIIQRRLSLPDNDRLVLGLVLKSLGQSINTSQIEQIEPLADRLASLQQQAKFYSSDNYLQPLLLQDTWVAVGWSMDLLPVVRRDRRINAITPASGTILTADLWVQPFQPPTAEIQQTVELANTWIDFFWQPDVAIQLSLLSNAASPIILAKNLAPDSSLSLPTALTNDHQLIPPATVMAHSEFILPLETEAIAQYQRYWHNMRNHLDH